MPEIMGLIPFNELELSQAVMEAAKKLNDLLRQAHSLPDVEVQVNIAMHYSEIQEKPIHEVQVRLLKEI